MTTPMEPVLEFSDPRVLAPHPLVSVYMAAYNHAPFIAEAIEGVLRQRTDFPIELVIAEDASGDRTREIAREYQQRRPDVIRLLTGPANVGARPNFRRSFPLLRGDFVAYCEGDDYWTDPAKLERQVAVFRARPACSLVFHAAREIDARDGRPRRLLRWARRSRRFLTEELVLGDGGLVPTASILVRRDVLAGQRPWALEAPVGDYPLVLSAALAGEVVYLDHCMSVYRTNVPQSWTQRHAPTLAHRLQYARRIEAMLRGFAAEAAPAARRAAAATVSKYYSDVIVRLDGTPEERAAAYAEAAPSLVGSDRLLAWLAARRGWRLARTKDLVRKAHTLLRLGRAELRRDLDVAEAA